MRLHNASKYSNIGELLFTEPISDLGYVKFCLMRELRRGLVKNGLVNRQHIAMENSIYIVLEMGFPQILMVDVYRDRILRIPFPTQNRKFRIKTQGI